MYINADSTSNSLVTQNSSEIYNQTKSEYTSSNSEESSSFQTALDEEQSKYVQEDTRTSKEVIEDMKKLVEDIESVIKTGMTPEEIEALEELLAKIKEEMEKENYNKKDIEEMLQELERKIAAYKKKISGEAITEADSIDTNSSKKSTESISSIEDITSRLDVAQEDIEDLKEGIKNPTPKQVSNQSELLTMIKKFQGE